MVLAVFLFEGSEEAGFDSIPAGLIDFEGFQAVPPGLGRTFEDAGPLLYFVAVITPGDLSASLNSLNVSASSGGVLAFISVKQRKVSSLLQAVMGSQGIVEVSGVWRVGHFARGVFTNLGFVFRIYLLSGLDMVELWRVCFTEK
jgi:hypothetical protein